MKRLIAVAIVVVLSACAPGESVTGDAGPPLHYVHDQKHAVGCWIYGGDGNTGKSVSCLPDQDYRP